MHLLFSRLLAKFIILSLCVMTTASFAQQRFFDEFYSDKTHDVLFIEALSPQLTLLIGSEVTDYLERKNIRHTTEIDNDTLQIYFEDFEDLRAIVIGKMKRIPNVQVFARAYNIKEYQEIFSIPTDDQIIKISNFKILSAEMKFRLHSNSANDFCTEFQACNLVDGIEVDNTLRPIANFVEKFFDVDKFVSTDRIESTRGSQSSNFLLTREQPGSKLFKEIEFLQNCAEGSKSFETNFTPFGIEFLFLTEKNGPSVEFLRKIFEAQTSKSFDLYFSRSESELSGFDKLRLRIFLLMINRETAGQAKSVELVTWARADNNLEESNIVKMRRSRIEKILLNTDVSVRTVNRKFEDCYYSEWRDFEKVTFNVY